MFNAARQAVTALPGIVEKQATSRLHLPHADSAPGEGEQTTMTGAELGSRFRRMRDNAPGGGKTIRQNALRILFDQEIEGARTNASRIA